MEKGHIQKTLDHGYVKLVDYMGDDNFPLENARMSTETPTGVNEKKDDGLRERLWADAHSSPFEMNVVCFEIQLPLFVLQQIDRHRTVNISNHRIEASGQDVLLALTQEDYDSFRKFHSENEFSGRYSTLPELYYSPLPKRFGGADPYNRQATGAALDVAAQEACAFRLRVATEQARMAYEELLELGAASEIARYAMIYTQYTKVRIQAGLKNWLDFLNLRLRTDVQVETRIYARQIARAIESLWPKTWAVFSENTLHAVKFNATERAMLTEIIRSLDMDSNNTGSLRQIVYEAMHDKLPRNQFFRFLDKILPTHPDPDYLRGELIIPESW